MSDVLTIIQIIVSTLLLIVILLQAKGTGLGRAWGGGGEFYRSKRGAEKILLVTTVVLAFLFLLSSLVNVVFK
jgi:preprotein translocase subunit SecG